MKIIPLPVETQSRLKKNVKIVLDYTDFSATGVTNAGNTSFTAAWTSGTAQVLDPPNLQAGQVGTYLPIVTGVSTLQNPAGIEVAGAVLNVLTAFTSSAGAIGSITFSLGDTGSSTRFINAASLAATGYTVSSTADYIEGAAWNLTGTVTISGQTMASLNGGSLELYLNLIPISDLTQVH